MGIAKELNQLCYNLTGAYSEQTTARGVLNDLISKLSGKASGEKDLSNAVSKATGAVKESSEVVWGGVLPVFFGSTNEVTQFNVPDGITEIQGAALVGTAALKKITAKKSLKRIMDFGLNSPFMDSPLLESVSFPGVVEVGASCFALCKSLTITETSFPVLEKIGTQAFADCTAMTYANFPSVKEVGAGAFGHSKTWSEVILPKCEVIGGNNFCGTTIEAPLVLPECRILGDGSMTNGDNLFLSLTCEKIVLPKIEIISAGVFSGKIGAIVLSNPRIIAKRGTNTFKSLTLDDTHGWFYVPKHLLNQYKKEWSDLAERFRAIEDYPEIME